MAIVQLPSPQDTASAIAERRSFRVLIRASWATVWVEAPYLEPLRATDAAAPSTPRAEFLFRYGRIKREDGTAIASESPLDLKDKFVKIELLPPEGPEGLDVAPTPLWYGQFVEQTFDEQAPHSDGTRQGDQKVVALGLAHLLDRTAVVGSYIEHDPSDTEPTAIDRALVFNQRHRDGLAGEITGNRSAGQYSGPWTGYDALGYVFAAATNTWSNLDIVDYLLAFYPPGNAITGAIQFTSAGQTSNLAQIVTPSVNPDNATVGQLLDKLIDRRRGMGWTVRVGDYPGDPLSGGEPIEVHTFSVFEDYVGIGSTTMGPNQEQVMIDLSAGGGGGSGGGGPGVGEAVVRLDTSSRYDRIVVRGAKVKSCFTVIYGVETAPTQIEKGWNTTEETAYKAASPATTPKDKDIERATDKYAHVYTTFRVPNGWEFASGYLGQNANPLIQDDGTVDASQQSPIRRWGHTFLKHLPFKSEQAIGTENEYRPPFAIVKDPTSTTTKYVMVDRLDQIRGLHSASLHMSEHQWGFFLKAPHNHMLAKGTYDQATYPTQHKPEVDYRTLAATVCMELDADLRVVAQVLPSSTTAPPGRVLEIAVPDAEMWYVPAFTVQDVKDGAEQFVQIPPVPAGQVQPNYVLLRDDSPRLRAIAAVAKAWYSTTRYAVQVRLDGITPAYPVGCYVKAVVSATGTSQDVGAVVTTRTYDFHAQTTTIETGFMELDFAASTSGGGGGSGGGRK